MAQRPQAGVRSEEGTAQRCEWRLNVAKIYDSITVYIGMSLYFLVNFASCIDYKTVHFAALPFEAQVSLVAPYGARKKISYEVDTSKNEDIWWRFEVTPMSRQRRILPPSVRQCAVSQFQLRSPATPAELFFRRPMLIQLTTSKNKWSMPVHFMSV